MFVSIWFGTPFTQKKMNLLKTQLKQLKYQRLAKALRLPPHLPLGLPRCRTVLFFNMCLGCKSAH